MDKILLFRHDVNDPNVLRKITAPADVKEGCLVEIVLSGELCMCLFVPLYVYCLVSPLSLVSWIFPFSTFLPLTLSEPESFARIAHGKLATMKQSELLNELSSTLYTLK